MKSLYPPVGGISLLKSPLVLSVCVCAYVCVGGSRSDSVYETTPVSWDEIGFLRVDNMLFQDQYVGE